MQDATAFRQAISHVASGVTIVTAATANVRAGMIASAVASVLAGARPLVYFRSGFGTIENRSEAMSRDLRPWGLSL
jgi:flavin reductase (DIM6/NTAB) family NADH-FMN oxidoreductase RutF